MEKSELRVTKYLWLKIMSTNVIFLDIPQTLEDDALPYSTVAYFVAKFKRGRLSCEDDPHSGPPSASLMEENVEEVEKLVLEDPKH